MNTLEFNATDTGKALQAILDCCTGGDGGIAYIELRRLLIAAEEAKQEPVFAQASLTVRQMAALIEIAGTK